MPLCILDFPVHFPNISESGGDQGYIKIDPLRGAFQAWHSAIDLGFVFIIVWSHVHIKGELLSISAGTIYCSVCTAIFIIFLES